MVMISSLTHAQGHEHARHDRQGSLFIIAIAVFVSIVILGTPRLRPQRQRRPHCQAPKGFPACCWADI